MKKIVILDEMKVIRVKEFIPIIPDPELGLYKSLLL